MNYKNTKVGNIPTLAVLAGMIVITLGIVAGGNLIQHGTDFLSKASESVLPASSGLLLVETWQSGKIDLTNWRITKDYPGMRVINAPNRQGKSVDKALYFEIANDTWDKCPANAEAMYGIQGDYFNCHDPATEIRVGKSGVNNLPWTKTYWYGWSVYFPSSNFTDVNMNFSQWHDQPGRGGQGLGPALAYRVAAGNVDTIVRSDTKNWSKILFKPEAGKWYDFVVNAKITPDNSGFAKTWVYSEGKLIGSAAYSGPLGHQDTSDPSTFWKMGMYIPTWRKENNVGVVKKIIIDEIRIGDESSSLASVLPGASGNEQLPTDIPPTTSPSLGTCITSRGGGAWINEPMTPQTGKFTVEFDAQPSVIPADHSMYMALTNGPASDNEWAKMAAAVRFSSSYINSQHLPLIQADKAAKPPWGADSVIQYSVNADHHFRLVVDVSKNTYTSYVTVPGQAEKVIGLNYPFRNETGAPVPQLDNFVVYNYSGEGSLKVCNFKINGQTPRTTESPTPIPTSGRDLVLTPTVVAPTEPPVETIGQVVTIEATKMNLSNGFVANGNYISQTMTTADATNFSRAGRAERKFTVVKGGLYRLKVNARAPNGANNSMFIAVNREPTINDVWDLEIEDGYVDKVYPSLVNLNAGTNQVIIRGREKNTEINSITLEEIITVSPTIFATPTFILRPSPTNSPTPTNTPSPTPTNTPSPTPTNTPTPTFTPTPTPIRIVDQAENMDLSGTMALGKSGGVQYIYSTSSYTTPKNAGQAKYTFRVAKGGTYRITFRVRTNGEAANSFFMGMSTTSLEVQHIPNKSGWQTYATNIQLNQGINTLFIRGREYNTQIDQFVIEEL